MLRVEFEPTIPVFEREKTVHTLDRAATVIGVDNVVQSRETRRRPLRGAARRFELIPFHVVLQ
jgi:hypothetical protein